MKNRKTMCRPCPVCGCREGENLFRVELAPVQEESLPSGFDVCLCSECLFCFDDLRAAQADFDAYYRSSGKYVHKNTGGSGGSSAVDLKRWENVIETLAPWISKESRIVDVGCGKGGLLAALYAHGYRHIVGIEPSLGCRETLASLHVAAYPCVGDCLAREVPFDCVICSQVLEHVFSLGTFLSDLSRLLSVDGLIYAELPDAAGYVENLHAPYYYFDREHINHFTPVSLNNLFSRQLSFSPVYNAAYSISAVAGFQTPNVFSVYKKGDLPPRLIPDEGNARKIRAYVERSEELDVYPQVWAINRDVHTHGAPVLLWGYGAHLRRLLCKGVFDGINVQGIIDRNKGGLGEKVMGLPVLAPEAIRNPLFRKASVVITTVLYAAQIEEALRQQAFEGRIIRISD